MTVRPPIVGAALWSTVMKHAGHRCECKGACGSTHDPERKRRQCRCDAENSEAGGSFKATVLLAVPRDPTAPFVEAAAMKPAQLIAFCEDCSKKVQATVTRARKAMPAVTEELFSLDDLGGAP